MSLPTLTGVGRLVDDPELRFTPQGKAVAKVRLAFSSRKRNDAGEWVDADKYFVDGTVWEQLAENVAESLTKGVEVFVSGRLKQRQYEDNDGNKRTAYDLMVDAIGPTLRYATAKVTKATRSDNSTSGSGGGRWSQDQPVPDRSGDFDQEPPF